MLVVSCLFPHMAWAKSIAARSARANSPIIIPLQYINGYLFAKFRGARMGRLLLAVDTGTQRTIVSSARVQSVSGLTGDSHRERLRGYGNGPAVKSLGHRNIALYQASSLIFRGRALVVDMRYLQPPSAPKIDGVLGLDFFAHWCVRLDYGAKQMSLYPPNQCPQPKQGRLRAKWMKTGILLPSTIIFANGRQARANLELDTGADWTIVLAPRFRRVAGVAKAENQKTAGGGGGVNGGFAGDYVSVTALNIDGQARPMQFRGPTTVLVRRRGAGFRNWWRNLLGEPRVLRDGGIGNRLLAKFVLTFDPAKKTVYAQPAQ